MTKQFANELNKIKENKKVLIIVDEITSGWRMRAGGVYKLNKLKADIVVYGKSMVMVILSLF